MQECSPFSCMLIRMSRCLGLAKCLVIGLETLIQDFSSRDIFATIAGKVKVEFEHFLNTEVAAQSE